MKFEEKIKEKLDERVIKPSNNSWERLSQQLDDKQPSVKNKRIKDWYRIAAVFIGVLFITSIIVYQNSSINKDEPKIVDHTIPKSKVIEEIPESKESPLEKYEISPGTDIVSNEEENKSPLHKKEEATQKTESIREDLKPKYKSTDDIAVADKETPIIAKHSEVIALEEHDSLINASIIQEKIEGVLAKVKEFEKNNIEITEGEIDQLLMQAQREITAERMLESGTISASTLLQEVEQELDDTFKQRVFDALKSGFQKVKTTVAQRKN
ncbi:hypothetical protein ABW636_01080 [Aquimarina sp. 2201CG1-2-11]